MKNIIVCFSFVALVAGANTVTQTWNATSSEWSVNAPNWDSGVVWTPFNAALFGESNFTNVVVPEITKVSSMTFNGGNWTFSGEGGLVTDLYGLVAAIDNGAPEGNLYVNLADEAFVDFNVAVSNCFGGNYEQRGGTVTISRPSAMFRTAMYGGTLRIVDTTYATAKFQDYSSDNSSKLYFDGACIAPINNNIILGETGDEFADIQVGTGGLTFTYQTVRSVSELRLKHAMRPADDIPEGSCDGGVTMAGKYKFKVESENCDLKGGFKFLASTNFLKYAAGIGTGPLYLDAPLFVMNSMRLTNSITFGPDGAFGFDSAAQELEFSNGTFSDDNVMKRINLLSQNGGGTIRHVMDENFSPFGGYGLSAGVTLWVDGYKWTACSDVCKPFVFPTTIAEEPQFVAVQPGGLEIDTAGENIALGVPFKFSEPGVVTNTIKEQMFENGSFEDGTTGWTFVGGKGGNSDIRYNGGPFDGGKASYQTPYPDNYAQVRSNSGSISTTFSPPESGEWRIAFEYANRHDQDPGGLLTWGVYINGEAIREKANDGLGNHGFITYKSPVMTLAAGTNYDFKFETGPSIDTQYGYDSMLVDAVRLIQEEVVTNIPAFTKLGEGTLVAPYLENPGTVNVQAGRLEMYGSYTGTTVNVSSGAELAFRSPGSVFVPNNSFEDILPGDNPDNGVGYTGKIPGWFLSGGTASQVIPGWQINDGAASPSGPYTTNGVRTAFMRPLNHIATHIYVPNSATYAISFEYALRRDGWGDFINATNMNLTVKVDGVEVGTISMRDAGNRDFVRSSIEVEISPGMHELKFVTDDGGGLTVSAGYMIFIDDVRIERPTDAFVDEAAVWNFASGSTVDVGSMDVSLATVYVDGVRVKGGTWAFRRAGVNVIGSGALRSGPPQGTVVQVR